MIFEITSLVHPTRKYVAKRIYKSSDSKALVADLEHLLGDEHTKVINLAGEIISEALVVLEGMEVDIEVQHHRSKAHEQPFCNVSQVKKRGALIETLKDET